MSRARTGGRGLLCPGIPGRGGWAGSPQGPQARGWDSSSSSLSCSQQTEEGGRQGRRPGAQCVLCPGVPETAGLLRGQHWTRLLRGQHITPHVPRCCDLPECPLGTKLALGTTGRQQQHEAHLSSSHLQRVGRGHLNQMCPLVSLTTHRSERIPNWAPPSASPPYFADTS